MMDDFFHSLIKNLSRFILSPSYAALITGCSVWIIGACLYFLHFPVYGLILILGLFCILFVKYIISTLQNKLSIQQQEYEQSLSKFRHDIRGLLTPALLTVDRITMNKTLDTKTLKSAESIAQSIEQVANYLTNTRKKIDSHDK